MIGIVNSWDRNLGQEWITSQWALGHSHNPWARVKGPMGATHMYLKEMGWQTQWRDGVLMLKNHQ
eukprot:10593062-Karenia_brevis.AAC.1